MSVSIEKHLLDAFHVPETLFSARHVALIKIQTNRLGPGLHGDYSLWERDYTVRSTEMNIQL